MHPCARTNIDDVVTLSHDIFIMFDYYDRIPYFRQFFEIIDEHVIVSWVKSDRWFIEHVDNSFKARSNLRRETNTLRLTT